MPITAKHCNGHHEVLQWLSYKKRSVWGADNEKWKRGGQMEDREWIRKWRWVVRREACGKAFKPLEDLRSCLVWHHPEKTPFRDSSSQWSCRINWKKHELWGLCVVGGGEMDVFSLMSDFWSSSGRQGKCSHGGSEPQQQHLTIIPGLYDRQENFIITLQDISQPQSDFTDLHIIITGKSSLSEWNECNQQPERVCWTGAN